MREARGTRLLSLLAVAGSLAVVAVYVACAGELIRYPWDWSPDEGLFLDWARRLLQDPRSLYGHSYVPFPAVYGPGLPLLLAPAAALGRDLVPAARVLALAWTSAGALAVYGLARPAGPAAALAAAALSIAALDMSHATMLLRPDGPMIALWLFAGVTLAPARLARDADRLGWGRAALGAALLLAATLTKLTAVVHGAPLVLCWLLVDRRSAARLVTVLVAAGGLTLLLLQWATAGGYLWANGVWGLHGTQAGLRALILAFALDHLWPLGLLAALALAATGRRWRTALGDGALPLLVGALLVVPLLSKYGASWNYMLPFLPATSVLAARWWALAAGERPRWRAAGAAVAATVAVVLAATSVFPLPTALDRRTADAFYSFVREHTRRTGGPILALRPELAYVLVGQPVEMEGSGFGGLARHSAPGSELVLRRLQQGSYTLLVELHSLPEQGGYAEAAAARYVHAGGCNLSFYFGTAAVHLFTRRDLPLYMDPPPATRCGGPSGS